MNTFRAALAQCKKEFDRRDLFFVYAIINPDSNINPNVIKKHKNYTGWNGVTFIKDKMCPKDIVCAVTDLDYIRGKLKLKPKFSELGKKGLLSHDGVVIKSFREDLLY